MDRTFWPTIFVLLAVFGIFEATGLDLRVQDHFYDFTTHQWLVDQDEPVARMLFYTGPKTLIWGLAITMFALACAPAAWSAKLPLRGTAKRDLWVLIATLATAPLLIAAGKATTNVFTPHEIRRYGGFAPYVKVIGCYPDDDRPVKRGRGFPAGHASGGFSLMAAAGLARGRRGRWLGVGTGLAAGSAMGIYQICKGAHYLSHTVFTALVCWIVFLALRKLSAAAAPQGTEPAHTPSTLTPSTRPS